MFGKKTDTSGILKKCLKKTGGVVSATDVKNAAYDPYSFYCDVHVNPSLKDGYSPVRIELMRLGREHEKGICGKLNGACMVKCDSNEAGFEKGLSLMAAGKKTILQMPLMCLNFGMIGIPDILEKKKGRSALGKHHYTVCEVKLATEIPEAYIIQAAFYNKMLGIIQEYTPEQFCVIDGDGKKTNYTMERYGGRLEDYTRLARGIIQGHVPKPAYGKTAYPWRRHGNTQAIRRGDISILTGESAWLYERAGIHTIHDLYRAKRGPTCQKLEMDDSEFGELMARVNAAITGKIEKKPQAAPFVEHPAVFVDLLEGDGIGCVIGVLIDGKKPRYESFEGDDKDHALMDFVGAITQLGNRTIYHWSHDTADIRKLMEGYSKRLSLSWNFEAIKTDLFEEFTKRFVCPDQDLPGVAGRIKFKYSDEGMDIRRAGDIIDRHARFPEKYNTLYKAAITYSKNNCMAMRHVRDWMVKQDYTS